MIRGRPGLEDSFLFEWPVRGGIPSPSQQSGHDGFNFGEVIEMVGAEIEPSPLACPACDCLEELCFQQAVFVVAGFGPGIGEQHPDFFKSIPGREGKQKLPGFSADEMAIVQLGAIAFFSAAFQTV